MKHRWIPVIAVCAALMCATAVFASDDDEGSRFTGTIASLPATAGFIGDWTVSGKTIHVTSTTTLNQEDGAIAVGAVVEVQGRFRADGSMDATKVEVKHGASGGGDPGDYVHFYGVISSLPATANLVGDWVISSQTVRVSATTVINQEHGPARVGASVEVEGNRHVGGAVEATKIEVKESGGGGDGENGGGGGFVDFYGDVTGLPSSGLVGDWHVNSRTVHVSSSTVINQEHGQVVLGAYVEVVGNQLSDGSVDATKIEVKTGSHDGEAGGFIRFQGSIAALPSAQGLIGEWTVSSRTVHVSASTVLNQEHGAIAVGVTVEVEGNQRPDGTIDAVRIEVKTGTGGNDEILFYGQVDSLPSQAGFIGDWVIAGKTVHVTAATVLNQEHGVIVVGAAVEVNGIARADGSVDATRIEVRSGGGSGGTGYIHLYGNIVTLPLSQGFIGDWVVGSQTVHVSATTAIHQEHGAVAVGAYVEIEGNQRPDGSVDATKVSVQGTDSSSGFSDFFGTISTLPSTQGFVGDWIVAGKTVHVSAATVVNQEHGAVAVGAYVEVQGNLRSDGSVDAVRVEVSRGIEGPSGGSDSVSFMGTVGNLPPGPGFTGDWLVSGQTVHVGASTRVTTKKGGVSVGSIVKVEGVQRSDRSIDATSVEVKKNASDSGSSFQFTGVVGSLPAASGLAGDWVVGGRVVHASAGTQVKQKSGAIAIGSLVEVEGSLQPDGSVTAAKIKLQR